MYTWVQSVITCPQSLKEPLTKPGYLAEFGGSWEMSKLSKIGKHFGIWSCFAMSVGTHVRCWSSKVCLLNRIWVCSKLGYLLGTLAIIFPAPRPQDCHGMPWHIPQFWANRDNTTLKVPQKLRSSPNWSPIWAKFPSLCWSHPGEVTKKFQPLTPQVQHGLGNSLKSEHRTQLEAFSSKPCDWLPEGISDKKSMARKSRKMVFEKIPSDIPKQ